MYEKKLNSDLKLKNIQHVNFCKVNFVVKLRTLPDVKVHVKAPNYHRNL